MTHKTENYNLLVEDWIPILWADGRPDRVGIRTALTGADRIRQIAASNPMDRVGILRFLLALLYWCKGNPPDDVSAQLSDSFPAHWFAKLDENQEYFNLLGGPKRFYQDPGAERSRAATDLIQEIPTGNNFWHFRHSTDGKEGLCAACCTMGLLRLPLFSVSGLPDLKAGINGKPPVYVVPLGKSLLDTLCANWATRELLGDPGWLQPNLRPKPGEEVPLLNGLTLLSRRVWLHEPSGPPGACSGCGEPATTLIRTCQFQTAGKQETDLWNDPHVVYLDKIPRRTSKAPDLTASGKFRMDRPWPHLFASMVGTGKFRPENKQTSLLVVGFATDQAKNIDVWERIVPVTLTEPSPETAISLLQQWHREGSRLEKQLEQISGSEIEGVAIVASIRPHVEDRVSAMTRGLLAGEGEGWEKAAREYGPMMAAIAKSLSPGFTVAAVHRRQRIASLAPQMQAKAAPAKKTSCKKGDEQ